MDNTRSLRQRQTRRKAATQSHGPTVPPGIWQPGRRRHLSGSEIVSLDPAGLGASLVRPHVDGEIAVPSITFDARASRAAVARTARPDLRVAADAASSRRSRHALTGAVDRSHTTPTPDPDPSDSGRRTSGALRLSELAPRLTRGAAGSSPGPAPCATDPLVERRSFVSDEHPRLGPAYPFSIGPRGRDLN